MYKRQFDEICRIVHYRMGLENDPRMMGAKIATNVASERSPVLRVMPLFVKNLAMKIDVYKRQGGLLRKSKLVV